MNRTLKWAAILLVLGIGSLWLYSRWSEAKSIQFAGSPGRKLDKAHLERFAKNPDEWVQLFLIMDYIGPDGEQLYIFFILTPDYQYGNDLVVNIAQGVDQFFSQQISGRKAAYPASQKRADIYVDSGTIQQFFLALLKEFDLLSVPLPCSICDKGWIGNKPELYKKGKEYLLLMIDIYSREEAPNTLMPKVMDNILYGATFKTDFPEPRNEEEKRALNAVRKIVKFAKEKFIDYGMKNYWCKKEYKGGKVVKAEPGNQPIPKYKECKPELR